MKNTVLVAIIVVIIIAIGIYYAFFQVGPTPTTVEQACINSGGTVRLGLCCKTTGDFPNMCLIGPCGCSPANTHEVTICDCGEGKCWDSDRAECVTI